MRYPNQSATTYRRTERLNTRDLSIISLIGTGISYDQAVKVFYTGKQYSIKLQDLKRNHLFIFALAKELKMKDEFKEAGVTEEWFALQLKRIVEDKDEPLTLRQKAIDLIQEVFGDKKQVIKGAGYIGSMLTERKQLVQQTTDINGRPIIRRLTETSEEVQDII